jgi:hypothetical protein
MDSFGRGETLDAAEVPMRVTIAPARDFRDPFMLAAQTELDDEANEHHEEDQSNCEDHQRVRS